jgi:hypothetical protein
MSGEISGDKRSAEVAPFLLKQAQAAYEDDQCVKDADTCSLALCNDTRPPTAAAPTEEAAMEVATDSSAQAASVALLPLALLMLSSVF